MRLAVVTLQVVGALVAEGAVLPLCAEDFVRHPHVLVEIGHLLVAHLTAELLPQMDTAHVHRAIGLLVRGVRAVIALEPDPNKDHGAPIHRYNNTH